MILPLFPRRITSGKSLLWIVWLSYLCRIPLWRTLFGEQVSYVSPFFPFFRSNQSKVLIMANGHNWNANLHWVISYAHQISDFGMEQSIRNTKGISLGWNRIGFVALALARGLDSIFTQIYSRIPNRPFESLMHQYSFIIQIQTHYFAGRIR